MIVRLLLEQGVYWPTRFRCEKNDCLYCAPRNVTVLADAIKFSQPRVQFTITNVPDKWVDIQDFMFGLACSLNKRAKRNDKVSWLYAAEPNPGRPGAHVHGYAHGWLDQEHMATYSQAHGCGLVQVKPITFHRSAQFGYPMKHLRYQECTTREQAQRALTAYRELNGAVSSTPATTSSGRSTAGELPKTKPVGSLVCGTWKGTVPRPRKTRMIPDLVPGHGDLRHGPGLCPRS